MKFLDVMFLSRTSSSFRCIRMSSFQSSEAVSKVQWPDHHGALVKRITGALEIVPFDAVEFAQVLSFTVVDPVEVGGATSIKPPACMVRRAEGETHVL